MNDRNNISVGFRLRESEYDALKEIARAEHRSIGSIMSVVTRAFMRDYNPENFKETLEKGKEE
jgi:hypothetical protein